MTQGVPGLSYEIGVSVMEDSRIIDLYWKRSEEAITESDRKYGRYCGTIAMNILGNREDVEECVSDTWLRAWNAIPPAKPLILKAFLGTITRNLFGRTQQSGVFVHNYTIPYVQTLNTS